MGDVDTQFADFDDLLENKMVRDKLNLRRLGLNA